MRITSLFPKARLDSPDTEAFDADDALVAVRRLNEEYLAAVRARDEGWFQRHLAGNVVVVLGDGRRLGKSEFLSMLEDESRRFRSLEARDVTLRAFGPIVQVDADAPWELADGTRGVSRYIDTWARLDGRWQVISAQVTVLGR